MKCIFQFWSATPHLETSLELAIKEAKSGEDVHYYWGGDDVLFNEDNRPGKLGLLFCSQKPIIRALTLVEKHFGKIFKFHSGWIRYDQNSSIASTFNLRGIDDVLKLKVEDFHVGRAAVSSLMQVMQADLTASRSNTVMPLLLEIVESGLAAYFSAKAIIDRTEVDEVIFFNGRFIHEAAILAACRVSNKPFQIHERGATPDKYWIVDYLVHDAESAYRDVIELWDGDLAKGISVQQKAKEFLDKRIVDGYGGAWISFSKDFDRSADFETVKKDIGVSTLNTWVFFQSSNDEYAAIDPSLIKETEWSRQEDVVNFLANRLPLDVTLIVRIHPHMQKKRQDDLLSWRLLEENFISKGLNVKFVWQDSNVNSYLLAENAGLVISCGSTIGAESVYLATPSICCGSSVWGFVDGVHQVFDFSDLDYAITHHAQPNPDVILPVAYWWASRGTKFEYFYPQSLFAGKFLDVDLFNDATYLTE
jgi:hypothetical protein